MLLLHVKEYALRSAFKKYKGAKKIFDEVICYKLLWKTVSKIVSEYNPA